MTRRVFLRVENIREEFFLSEVEDWNDVALRVRALLQPGIVVALSGPLGAGKTTFVQALAREVGIRETPQSPTFALLRTYRLPKAVNSVTRIVHVDAYRIEDEKDVLPLDLDAELADGKSALVLEWPENVPKWVARRQLIMIDIHTEF